MRKHYHWLLLGVIVAVALALPFAAFAGHREREVVLSLTSVPASPQQGDSPAEPNTPVVMVLDDGTAENNLGLTSSTASYQYIWFNRFTPAAGDFPFQLTQVRMYFSGGSGLAVGDAIDIVIYEDADHDPANGATLLTTYSTTIQVLDNWSVYSLPAPVAVNGPASDVLVAAINRYAQSGVTPPSYPSALDTNSSNQRSWVGWWTTDPPNPAVLPPDDTLALSDDLGFAGNFLIRAYGVKAPTAVNVTALAASGSTAPVVAVLVVPAILLAGLVIRRRMAR